MTAAEREEQRRSFAYGNTNIENERVTRRVVDEQADRSRAPIVTRRACERPPSA